MGVTETVQTETSEVLLLNDPVFRTTVMIGENNAEGLLVGEISGVFIDKVPITNQIESGQPVFTSGLDGYTQRGWLIGQVADVSQPADEVFYKITIATPVSFDHLDFVEVASR